MRAAELAAVCDELLGAASPRVPPLAQGALYSVATSRTHVMPKRSLSIP